MSSLSQDGINLAKSVTDLLETYDLVVTSTLPRAIETAETFGYPVNIKDRRLNTYGEELNEIIQFLLPFTMIAEYLQSNKHFKIFAEDQISLYNDIVKKLPQNGKALIVSHGGVIDIPLVALFPNENHEAWGEIPFGYCEGFRIYYDVNLAKFTGYELLRVTHP